jgi:predicted amidohydrolase
VFLDKEATLDKACSLIAEASRNGARLIAFPETYIPTYPYWTPEGHGMWGKWVYSWRELLRNSIEIPSEDTQRLCDAAKKAEAVVVMGLNERDRLSQGTIYNTMLFIDQDGRILGSHRKLMPTAFERMYWGRGDGSGLNVFQTDLGRISGLICAENFMVLPKYALFAQGEQIHCSTWPGAPGGRGGGLKPSIDAACRCLALEGGVWVVNCCGYITEKDVPDDFMYKESIDFSAFGGSAIVGPRGNYVAGPAYDEETIVYGEIDMGEIGLAKCAMDMVGHYARPEVLSLNLNKGGTNPLHTSARVSGTQRPEEEALRQAAEELIAQIKEGAYPELMPAAEKIMKCL